MILKRIVNKLFLFVQFIPATLFLYKFKSSGDWVTAFSWGAIAGIIYIAAEFFVSKKFDKILLSFNCFVIGGAAMFWFDIGWLKTAYEYLAFATPLVWFLVIGLFTTFFFPGGFIGFEKTTDRKKVIGLSLLFLVAVCGAIGIAFYFKGDLFKGAVLPWITLMIFKDFLLGEYVLAGVGVIGTALLFLLKNGVFKGGIILWIGLKVAKGFLKGRNS